MGNTPFEQSSITLSRWLDLPASIFNLTEKRGRLKGKPLA